MIDNSGLEFEGEGQEQQGLDYAVQEDGAFTLDDQEAITHKRELLDKEIKNKEVFKKIVEVVSVSFSSYAIARLIILSGGIGQLWFAVAFVFLLQQIQNRDMLADFNVNYSDGWQIHGGAAVLKFLGTLIGTGFICWLALGDVVNSHRITEQTYSAMLEQVHIYNEAPKDQQEKMIGMVLVGVLSTLLILGIYANISRNNSI